MKTIGLLHTVPSVLATFGDRLRSAMPGVELLIHNTMDTFLASDANIHGFTRENLNRLFFLLKALELEHPDVIVVTCSTLTPHVEQIRPFISTPVVAIDDAMASQAVRKGERITVLATAYSTIGPTTTKLRSEASKIGRTLELQEIVCDEAYTAIKKLDQETHDRIVKEAAASIKNRDAIVLAQASMAHLEREIETLAGIPTFSSPDLCVTQVKDLLEGK
ncbi:MAG: aspartate/glutamate racemase family protein [Acetivibrionales bacterium]|jgi:Asp/Glu/hydantoin racemase